MGRGIDTSGEHSVESYQLGRGKLYAALLDATGHPKSFEDLGNVPELTASVESEKLDHFGSRSGLKTLDKSVVVQVTTELGFQLEDINFNNLARFFSGDTAAYTNPAIAGVVDAPLVDAADLVANAWYMLRTPTGPAFGITATNALVIESTNDTPVVLTATTDYTVDEVSGQVFIKSSTAVDAIIAAGVDGLTFTLTADATATTVDQLTILSNTELNVALRFVLEEADSGKQVVYDYHQVALSSDGDYSLISDEFAQLPMTASVEENDAYTNVADVYYPVTQ